MGFIRPNFKDLTYKDGFLECRIGLAKFGWRFQQAQTWLDKSIANKMYPVMPYRTGALVHQTKTINDILAGSGRIRTYGLSYGRDLYSGINPKTGQPYHWTNPNTQPRWAQYAYMTYKTEILNGIKHILKTGSYPDGNGT